MGSMTRDISCINWAQNGRTNPASFDLRSDTITIPTASMLNAIQSCTLGDDVFGEDDNTTQLETYVARRTGKEAGLYVLSGTMGNQLALRSLLTQPPYSVLCDYRSHIFAHEAGGTSPLSGAQPQPVVPKNGKYLTLEDLHEHVVLGQDIHTCLTRVISLENTIHGLVMPLHEIERISTFAKEHGIKMHLDGARLWEACVAKAGTLTEFCRHFDTVSLCLSKGLGAPVGSVLVGTEPIIRHARWVRKSIGGGIRQAGILTSAGLVAIRQHFGESDFGEDGLLPATHEMARRVEDLWINMGGRVIEPAETNMCWLDLKAAGCSTERFVELGKEAGLVFMSHRLVTHYQVAQNADYVLRRLKLVFRRALEGRERMDGNHIGKTSVYSST
ncbi:hypothetical protein CEP51_005608 [Fusarium floridanum]|uniref:Aromatic amino acid beta-eliminating lyase/threonine aldolase domain-containing protein n=1 Tax=Fusarium floridanum TaxID=1325733 RepID=A0A428RW25_9HYPO|nr:hypothetical protein CEP51_005608 [Fusarium floridanum]